MIQTRDLLEGLRITLETSWGAEVTLSADGAADLRMPDGSMFRLVCVLIPSPPDLGVHVTDGVGSQDKIGG